MTLNFDKLLRDDVCSWVEGNLRKDIPSLALQKSPFPDIPMRALVQQIQGRQIAKYKFPLLDSDLILFPPKLNLEQTSSATTADYKAQIVKGNTLIDITGGLGIDAISFASKFEQVNHIEQNCEVQHIAQHNFGILGLHHIKSVCTDGLGYLKNTEQRFDVLYVDPSRRNEHQKKVFLLQDLSPHILAHLDLFFEKAQVVLLKLSPLIDLTYLQQVLPHLAELHVVAVKNEVKEVLVKLQYDTATTPTITAVNLQTLHDHFDFTMEHAQNMNCPTAPIQKYLYEPNAAIQKSGGNDVLANEFGLKKLHPNTQLYTLEEYKPAFPGRVFEVLEDIKNPKKELKNKSILAVHRNFGQKLQQLQKKFRFRLDGVDPILFTQDIQQHHIKRMRLLD